MKSPLFSYWSGGARARLQKCSGPDRFYASPPRSSRKRTILSRPSPVRRLLSTNGRVPRMRLVSRSMFSSEAPT